MFAALPVMWTGFTGWITKNPVVLGIGGVLLLIIGWEKVKADIRSAAKKAERQAAEAKTIETVRNIEKEARADADAAIEARNTAPRPGAAGGVSDAVAARIFHDN